MKVKLLPDFQFFSFRNILEHCLNCYGEITDMDSDTG